MVIISNKIIKINDYKTQKSEKSKENILEKFGIQINEEMLFEQLEEEKRREYGIYGINRKK